MMFTSTSRRRRWSRDACRFAAVVCAVMLAFSSWVVLTGGQHPAAAATNKGSLVLDPTSGNGDDTFSLAFAPGTPVEDMACPGDSASGGYRVQGFVVPASQVLDDLVFNSVGPTVGQALYDQVQDPLVNGQTDITTANIGQLPGVFTFAANAPGDFTDGVYNVGVACTVGTGAGMTKSYWSVPIQITNDPAGGAAQITWEVTTAPPTTTTTTDGSGTTTTTDGSGTTTTTDGSGTTTTTTTEVLLVGPPLVLSQQTVSPGESVVVKASGWQPGSEVVIALHSDPVQVGVLTADANGDIDGPVTIPEDAVPGFHTLVAVGVDASGQLMGSTADLTIVGPPTPVGQPTGGSPSAASPVSVAGQLPYTGSSPLPIVVWAIGLLVFGRMAMLLGKRPKVLGTDPTG